jgi:hypothetical protein
VPFATSVRPAEVIEQPSGQSSFLALFNDVELNRRAEANGSALHDECVTDEAREKSPAQLGCASPLSWMRPGRPRSTAGATLILPYSQFTLTNHRVTPLRVAE